MRWIARRGVRRALSAWVLSMGFTTIASAAPPAAGDVLVRRPAPEWTGPPIEVPPPCVADGSPSRVRSLRLVPPRVKVLSIEAVLEPSSWEAATARPAEPHKPR